MNSISYAFELSQAERLELAAIGTREPTPAPTRPPFDYAPLRERIKMHLPRAPRCIDEDEGETAASLAIMGEDEQEAERTYAPHVLPSMRNRGSVYAEMKAMGMAWND